MGRRATSTTKGGRYINPADQERKMARKKELKKNKKQRHLVRQTVLKSKDPSDLLKQMEKLDEIEFSDLESKPLSERVMQEKRTKLRETYIRILGMYKREEEMEKFGQLKRQLQAYDQKRTQMEQEFVAQKFARDVNPSEIPLPDAAAPPPEAAAAMTPAAALASRAGAAPFPPHLMMPDFGPFGIPVPGIDMVGRPMGQPGMVAEPHSILKKARKRSTVPPGPPVGSPPELSDFSDEEDFVRSDKRYTEEGSEQEEDFGNDHSWQEDEGSVARSTRVRFDATAVEDLEDKDSRAKYREMAKRMERGEITGDMQTSGSASTGMGARTGAAIPPPPSLGPGGPPMMRPPVGAGPGGMRMPPPPPPGFPSARVQRPANYVGHVSGTTAAMAAVLSAPPSINKPKQGGAGAIIEAKPQLRNMQQEVTRLVPTAVKLRREQHASAAPAQKKPKGPLVFRTPEAKLAVPGSSVQHAPQKSTDEAYDDFMKEIHSLL